MKTFYLLAGCNGAGKTARFDAEAVPPLPRQW